MSDAPTIRPPAFRLVDEQLAVLRKGAAEIVPENEFRAKLERSRASGKQLRVKLGVDPTAPDLHLGHTVVLRKLRHFQQEGHTAIFLIGDFTAMVGDPTGQSETRPPLTREQVRANAETYLAQVYKILDPKLTEVRYNSEWLAKLTAHEIVQLCAKYTVPRMLDREDFYARIPGLNPGSGYMKDGKLVVTKEPFSGRTLYIHELLYPLFQAYDSVILQADVELGATEQKLNLLVGRDLQIEYGQKPQVTLTMPILVGTDGERKMSKSLRNYIGITEAPSEMFGKIMSISDEVMWSYYELVTDFASPVIVRLREEVRTGVLHPKKAKMQLARTIVADFHGEAAASKASDEFDLRYSKKELPTDMVPYDFDLAADVRLTRVMMHAGVESRSAAERLIRDGAVEIDGVVVRDPGFFIDTSTPRTFVLKVGKKKPPFIVRIGDPQKLP